MTVEDRVFLLDNAQDNCNNVYTEFISLLILIYQH